MGFKNNDQAFLQGKLNKLHVSRTFFCLPSLHFMGKKKPNQQSIASIKAKQKTKNKKQPTNINSKRRRKETEEYRKHIQKVSFYFTPTDKHSYIFQPKISNWVYRNRGKLYCAYFSTSLSFFLVFLPTEVQLTCQNNSVIAATANLKLSEELWM